MGGALRVGGSKLNSTGLNVVAITESMNCAAATSQSSTARMPAAFCAFEITLQLRHAACRPFEIEALPALGHACGNRDHQAQA